ncbi:ABC transporter substrate-binding protein [Lactobacillus sp. LC28-10]|uniref:ABC transporter substrate-binding protein n=1 Tax=Secundilactobacillus angelensis TaxID=2722706 RepID=A0ABX1KUG9_9LACO|nr:ABC transporter substrate-binding protein [Secundilactobacillus angelensis]MCH5461226.1 ABC transporter substrate-binding protein [Secundilactobacillus angelensis]NLR17578.1 ABC transporter substrate-binding protein [Secundilactobacillus angelensis]
MKRGNYVITALIGLLSVTLIASGCSNSHQSARSTAKPATRTVTDMSGTKVTIPKKVNRVADLWHANNQTVMLLGGQNKLVATTQMIKKQPWFNTIYPSIKQVKAPFSGDTMQVESLLKVKPDVVISADPGQIKQARNAKVPVVNAMYQNFDGLRRSVNLTANVLGGNAPAVAKTYQKELSANLDQVKTQLNGVSSRPSVLHIVNDTNLNVVDGRQTIVDEWIKAAGGQNALSQKGNMISVTTEKLAKSNPDIIIVGNTTSKEALKALQKDPVLSKLSAVKKGRVYGNPQGTFPWDRYSAEEALQVLWAAQKLHPAQFKHLNMTKKTQAFYQKYYHYQLTAKQANLILTGSTATQ